MTKDDLWTENLEFYHELVTKYKWTQEPMIELILHFKQIGLCQKYFPSNSHEALGLSTAEAFKERLLVPMVYIKYQSATKSFKIFFQHGQGKTIKEITCQQTVDDLTISEIENWLTNVD